jgi:ribosome-associated translation inhibitor RaiA
MRNPVEISLRGIPHSPALERYIDEEGRKLEQVCDRVLTCRVVAQALNLPRRQGVKIAVGLAITLPGTEVVVNREHGEDVFIALRDAFEAARLQLKDHMRRQSKNEHQSRNGAPKRGG